MNDLQQLASDVVKTATKSGATAADCVVREGSEFSTTVRCNEIEQLKESGAKGVGLRVFLGHRTASSYTSDFSPKGIERLVSSALAAARVTSEDPCAGLPEAEHVGSHPDELDLYYDDVSQIETSFMIDLARKTEQIAFDCDPRIRNSEGGTFDSYRGRKILATSQGFFGEYRHSTCSLSVAPIAVPETDGKAGTLGMQRDYWYSLSRSFAGLETPEQVARKAAERTLRKLGARKVSTCRVPIILDQLTAGSLLQNLFEAINGDAIYRGASFLVGKLGEKVASEHVTIVDDGTMPGGFGSSPFDGEGVRSGRTVVMDRGVLKSYMLNCYAARKLGMKTTGNASRGMAGNPGIGPTNFFLQPGPHSPDEIIRSVKNGFYVTDFIGFGVNAVTGDFSRGASGMWIENGELAYPVEEVTVAGNLLEMFHGIAMVGTDLEFRGSVASPTLKISEMTVAGN
ncbi:MAG: TldD/PmbA family protein [Acidobacteria bacterium]|nr:TldD/PmbA family protein [Acidobacteriota bacterium]